MIIDSTIYPKTIQTSENQYGSSAAGNSSNDEHVSFKETLTSVKQTEGNNSTKDTKTSSKVDETNKENSSKAEEDAQNIKNSENQQQAANSADNAQKTKTQSAANKVATDKKANEKADEKAKADLKEKRISQEDALNPIDELKSKIQKMSELKNNSNSNSTSKTDKSKFKDLSDIGLNGKTIKMDKNDALFFANLVKNNDMSMQKTDANNSTFTDIKSDATQKSMQVSSVLMDALKDSMQTSKPVRIDFDKDIAVIMKVSKDGKLSAEFIPGDQAVENYLRNNIPMLQQSFDEQQLPYENLSYRRQQQQQEQQERRNQNNKENKDE